MVEEKHRLRRGIRHVASVLNDLRLLQPILVVVVIAVGLRALPLGAWAAWLFPVVFAGVYAVRHRLPSVLLWGSKAELSWDEPGLGSVSVSNLWVQRNLPALYRGLLRAPWALPIGVSLPLWAAVFTISKPAASPFEPAMAGSVGTVWLANHGDSGCEASGVESALRADLASRQGLSFVSGTGGGNSQLDLSVRCEGSSVVVEVIHGHDSSTEPQIDTVRFDLDDDPDGGLGELLGQLESAGLPQRRGTGVPFAVSERDRLARGVTRDFNEEASSASSFIAAEFLLNAMVGTNGTGWFLTPDFQDLAMGMSAFQALTSGEDTWETLSARALFVAFHGGPPYESEGLAGRAVALGPSSPVAALSLAAAFMGSNNWDEAYQAVLRAQAIAPESPEVRLALARIQRLTGRYEFAMETQESLLGEAWGSDTDVWHAEARIERGLTLLQGHGLADEAMSHAQAVVQGRVANPDTRRRAVRLEATSAYYAQAWSAHRAARERGIAGATTETERQSHRLWLALADLAQDRRTRARGRAATVVSAVQENAPETQSAIEALTRQRTLAVANAVADRPAEAREAVRGALTILALFDHGVYGPGQQYLQGVVAFLEGQRLQAVDGLAFAAQVPGTYSPFLLGLDPLFAPLMSEPTFREIVRRPTPVAEGS